MLIFLLFLFTSASVVVQKPEKFDETANRVNEQVDEVIQKVRELEMDFSNDVAINEQEPNFRITRKSDETYRGFVRDEIYHGIGKLKTPDHEYIGQWKNGIRHGIGKLSSGKDIYIGDFRFDEQHGYGRLTTEDGEEYRGEWRVGGYDGFGILRYPSHHIYKGFFRDGSPHGYGEFRAPDQIYEGYWANGKREGPGKLILTENMETKFEGLFHDDRILETKETQEKPKKKKTHLPIQ